jgi:hypothetical protein
MINSINAAGEDIKGALVFPIADLIQKILDEVVMPDAGVVNGIASKKIAAELVGVNENTGVSK